MDPAPQPDSLSKPAPLCMLCKSEVSGELATCPSCAVAYHAECVLEMGTGTCAVLGCEGVMETGSKPPPRREPLELAPPRREPQRLVGHPVLANRVQRFLRSLFGGGWVFWLFVAPPGVGGTLLGVTGRGLGLVERLVLIMAFPVLLCGARFVRRRRAEQVGFEADGSWHPSEARDRMARRGVGVALFLSPLLLYLIIVPEYAEGLICVSPPLIAWGVVLLRLSRSFKFRGAGLSYASAPLRLGEPLELRFRLGRALSAVEEIEFRLLHVREEEVTTGSGRSATAEVVATCVHDEVRRARPADAVDGVLPLVFRLPTGLAATHLSADLPVYYELVVDAAAPGIDFHARYLLPVY